MLKAALSEFNQGNFTACQARLLEYTRQYPEDSQGWGFLGTVALELENDSLAQVVLDKAVALNPQDFKAWTGLGILARKDKDDQKAAGYYAKAIEINPDYGKAYSSLLIIELRQHRYQEAVELGEKAIRLSPKDLVIGANLAAAYHYNGQLAKRDSLMKDIEAKGYPNVENLYLLFNGEATLDGF